MRQIKESAFGEWIGPLRILTFSLHDGRIFGCILLKGGDVLLQYKIGDDTGKGRNIQRSVFNKKKFKMDGKIWITSEYKQFRKKESRDGNFV